SRFFGLSATPTASVAKYNVLKQRYASSFPAPAPQENGFGAAAYDAAYVFYFALAANGNRPVTGPNLADAISKLVPGPGRAKIDVDPANINTILQTLSSGGG